MKKRYYLIDTENVGDRWMELLESFRETYILVVFYTRNHSRLLEECFLKQRYNKQIRWVECEAGNNALDQQLMGVLSYLISTHPEAEYVIFSNDSDYGMVIDFWKKRGRYIERVGFDPSKRQLLCPSVDAEHLRQMPHEEKQKSMAEAGGLTDITFSSAERMTEDEIVTEIAKAIPIENMEDWYVVLTTMLGVETGRVCYICLREDKERRRELSKFLLSDTDERNVHLIALLYQFFHMDEQKASSAYKIVRFHSRKNKKAMKEAFDDQFGNKDGQLLYYKVLKPVLGILKGK